MNENVKIGIKNSIKWGIVGIVLAFLINQTLVFALSTDLPVVAVESNSMVPTFQKGDILVLKGVPKEELEVGDIIVFSPSPDRIPVVHRIIKINDDGTFQTMGDANSAQLPFEKRIEYSQIHGKVIMIIPYLGWIKLVMMELVKWPNLLIVLLVVSLGFLAYGIASEWKSLKSRGGKNELL